jgi:polygalacturonase
MKSTTRICTLLVSTMFVLAVNSATAAIVIHVPADQPTIQAAINAANNGDTVLVAPGTYLEILVFWERPLLLPVRKGRK